MLHESRLKVVILGLNYAPEQIGIAVYTTGLAEALVKRGHSVSVIAGKPYYPAWQVEPGFRKGWFGRAVEEGVDVARVAHYVPSKPTGLKRILHHVSFLMTAFAPLFARAVAQRPDVIIAVAPSLIAAPLASFAAWVTGCSCWLHVQDFEVEAAFATGLVGKKGVPATVAQRFETAVLRMFDRVSSISPAMCNRLMLKSVPPDRIVEFRNWADIDSVKPLNRVSAYRLEWGVDRPHVALYSGNIANKQGADIILKAAFILQDREDIQFIICGEGANRRELEFEARNLKNVIFMPTQPKERLGDLLGLATVHLLPQLAGAADLVLPSKLTNMLASGRPVVATAAAGSGLAMEVEGCGKIVRPGDPDAFAAAIVELIDNRDDLRELGRAARKRAEERWKSELIIESFERELIALVSKDNSPSPSRSD